MCEKIETKWMHALFNTTIGKRWMKGKNECFISIQQKESMNEMKERSKL